MNDLSLAQDIASFNLLDAYVPGGDFIPASEIPGGDVSLWGNENINKVKNQKLIYSPDDFSDGSYPPYYTNEIDAARNRAEARNLKQFTSTWKGATTSLTNYVVHTGYTYEVTPRKEFLSPETEKLANVIQAIIDEFMKDSKFIGNRDRMVHDTATDEGQYILGLFPDKKLGKVKCKEMLNNNLTEPRDKEKITNWLIQTKQIPRGTYNWSYGVLTKFDKKMNDFDPVPIGYHFSHNNTGSRWNYLPSSRVFHLKMNCGIETAKLGVSDWYEIIQDVRDELKLRGNTAHSAIYNAALVGVRQHSAKTTRDQVRTLHDRLANAERIREGKHGSSQVRQQSINDRPHIADISQGMEWQAGPMGTLNHPIFVEIVQMILKAIGRRWNMPEYLISQDASNANMASTIVSESPFVKTVETRQAFLISEFIELIYKVIAIHKGMRQRQILNKYSMDFIRNVLSINVDAPEIVSRDPDKKTARFEILHNNRVISKRSWASKEDLDYDEEAANMEQEPDDFNSAFGSELEDNTRTIY